MEENSTKTGAAVQDKMEAEESKHRKRRDNIRWRRFFVGNLILPSLIASVAMLLFGIALFQQAGFAKSLFAFVLHFGVLFLLLLAFWVKSFCAIDGWFKRWKRIILPIDNVLCFFFLMTIFPYQLTLRLVDAEHFSGIHIVLSVILLIVLFSSLFPEFDFSRIRKLFQKQPSLRIGLPFQLLKQLSKFLFIAFSFLIVEMWFLAFLATPDIKPWHDYAATSDLLRKSIVYEEHDEEFGKSVPVAPYAYLFNDFQTNQLYEHLRGQAITDPGLILLNFPNRDDESDRWNLLSARLAAWFFAGVLLTCLIIATGGITMQLMEAAMPTALFQIEKSKQNAKEIIMKSGVYARNLREYLVRKYSFTVVGGFLGTFIYLGIATIMYIAGMHEIVIEAINEDTFFFAFALFAAWVAPLIIAINKVDDIFSENFNRAISDIIMSIQDHAIFCGYSDLGKRVVDRDIRRTYIQDKKINIIELVTPDMLVARICISALVIERTDRDFVYAAEGDLLGRFGVVEIGEVGGMRLEGKQRLRQPTKEGSFWEHTRGWIYSEKKPVLVPALKGSLAEPFTFARANLERAKLLISTVAEHYGVNAAFDSLSNLKTKAILCITRSDQLNYLTYRTSTRPVTLVYPIATQGATVGQRVWAAVEKMKALRNLKGDDTEKRPKVYIIGENIAKHYMLENLWINVPGSYKEKSDWIENHVAFIVAETPDDIHNENVGVIDYLISHASQNKYDRFAKWKAVLQGSEEEGKSKDWKIEKYYLPLRFGTGGRYTTASNAPLLKIPVYDIRHAFGSQLDDIFQQELPDIIVINPDNLESSLRVMMLTIRALERVQTSPKKATNARIEFPLILFTLLRGSRLENIAIGDLSRFYNGLVMLYGDELARDESYPAHARWNRIRKKIVREAIIDSNADPDEIISGIYESQLGLSDAFDAQQSSKPGYMEINTCVSNVPGCLASLTAHLAGLQFSSKNRPRDFPESESVKIPSFQYLRSFQMDAAGRGMVVTGYATLNRESRGIDASGNFRGEQKSGYHFYTRLYVNDGQDYNRESGENARRKIDKTTPPTVPEAIDYMTGRKRQAGSSIAVQRFKKILLDSQGTQKIGEKACPNMNTCPVASYQDYVVASNRIGFIDPALAATNKLKFSENYYCRENFLPVKTSPSQESNPSARIMLCARGEKGISGTLAHALNTFLFRSVSQSRDGFSRDDDKEHDWVFNIQYMKDMPCHNRFFGINRIFGFWMQRERSSEEAREKMITMFGKENPIQLIEILPIGDAENAKEWLEYARLMLKFINLNCERPGAYRLVWFNKSLKCSDSLTDDERILENNILENPPVAIVISKQNKEEMIRNRTASQAGDYRLCTICGLQGREHSCEKWRPWYKENEFRWDVEEECQPAAK